MNTSQLDFLRSPAGAALLTEPLSEDSLGALKKLRRTCNSDQAAAVMTLRDLRRRAEGSSRFPAFFARNLLATDKLLQQASSFRLALYVARVLVPQAGTDAIFDLCCGMGVDAIALAVAGGRVRGIDRSAEAALCASHNASVARVSERCAFDVADVNTLELPHSAVIHVDPDRRSAGRRFVALAEYSPGPEFLHRLTARTQAGAMKLSPALDCHAIDGWDDVSLEYLSEGGTCRQLVLWWPPAPWRRRATAVFGDLEEPQSASIESSDATVSTAIEEPGPWLIEPDPAVIAARAVDTLAVRHRLWRIDANLAWLFGPQPVETPLARSYRILRQLPGRAVDVARAVRDLGGGLVQVKPRGIKLDTDALQRQLRGKGDQPLVALWCKTGRRQTVFLARPHGG